MNADADHWEGIHSSAPATTRSWYQREPTVSLRLFDQVSSDSSAPIVDVGSGTSPLVDRLLARGFTDVTLLDISPRALDEVRHRLGARARDVAFVRSDVLAWKPESRYDVWHDRAVFHFLTEPSQIARYVALAHAALRDGGTLIVATFAEDGPSMCSGLPVHRYASDELADTFGDFAPVLREREEHTTPAGVVQPFTWVVLRKT